MLSTVLESCVDWLDVLVTAHRSYPCLCIRIDRLVLQTEAHSVPALSNLGVWVRSHVQVSINLSHYCGVQRTVGAVNSLLKCVMEDNLQIAVEAVVDLILTRLDATWSAVASDVSISEIG